MTATPAAGTILPAALSITADDKTRTTSAPNPPLTATYRGFVAGETAAVLGGGLTLTTAAGAGSPAGAYAIVPWGTSSSNYTIRFIDGTLTVIPAAPTFTLALPSAAEQQRDARLADRPAVRLGAPIAECRPPTPNERMCTGWPVCEAERPVCQARSVEPGR